MTKKHKLEDEEESFNDQIDFYKHTVNVHSTIKDEITSDYVMAKFDNQKDKDFLTEMVDNAYAYKSLYNQLLHNARENAQKFNLPELTEEEEDRIEHMGSHSFKTFITKLTMLAVVNRNVKNNELLGMLTQPQAMEEEEEEPLEGKALRAVKKKLKKRGIDDD